MNYMKQVAEMLGVELGEEFTTNIDDSKKYKITSEGLFCLDSFEDWFEAEYSLMMLLIGKLEIKWQPGLGETFYFPDFKWNDGFNGITYTGSEENLNIMKNVGCYKTPSEAQRKSKELGWLE